MMVSDNGPCFQAYEFVEFCKHNHIKHITVSPHHSASNGLAERAVQIFKRGVKKLPGNINENISHFLLYNSSNYYWGFTLNADVKSSDTYQS